MRATGRPENARSAVSLRVIQDVAAAARHIEPEPKRKDLTPYSFPILMVVLLLLQGALSSRMAWGDAHCPNGIFGDSFEDADIAGWSVSGSGEAGASTDTADHGAYSMFLRDGSVAATSPELGQLQKVSSATLTVWIRRGGNFADSAAPEADLVLEYKAKQGNQWRELEIFPEGGPPGEEFSRTYNFPADALHNKAQLRFRYGDTGNPAGWWHVDSICVETFDSGKAKHFAIQHDGSAVSCSEEQITIEAHKNNDDPVDPGNIDTSLDAINQSTGAGEGTWARVIDGSGTLRDGTAGDGAGAYTWPGNGETSVTLAFNYTTVAAGTDPETVNFDVNGGNEGTGEDPDLMVSRSGFRFTDGAGNPINVPTQIAGKSSATTPGAQSLGLQAIRTSDGDPSQCEPAYPDGSRVAVELGAECRDPATCAGSELAVTNDGNTTVVDTSDDNGGTGASSYEAVELVFGANAEASLALAYPDAGALQLHARANPIDDGTTSPPVVQYITGSSNDFVVRPFGFYLDFDPDGNGTYDDRAANGTCGDQTSCSADAGGDVFDTAGTDFALRIAAVVWQSADDADDDGRPDGNRVLADNAETPNFGQESTAETVDIAHALVAPSGGASGSVANSSGIGGFAGGARVATDLRYSEAGIIDLDAALSDGAYLGTVDVTGAVADVGRFIPADFDQTATDGTFRNVCAAVHTYIGQEFSYQSGGEPTLTITARNGATPPATTQNYTGAFAKLVPGDIDRTGPTTDSSRDGADGTPLEVIPSLSVGTLSDNGDGTLTYTFASDDNYRYKRNLDRDGDNVNDARVAPFDSDLTVTIDAIEDSDNVSAPAANREDIDPAATELRFGRLVIDNAAGAEVAPVEQVLRAEYFESDANGDRWLVNTDDGCTAFALDTEVQLANNDDADSPVPGDNEIDIAGGITSIQEAGPVALTSGTAVLTFSAPGASNTGWVDTTALLTGNEHPYLAIDPEGDGSWTTNPTGRVTFGIYTGRDSRILLREIPAN